MTMSTIELIEHLKLLAIVESSNGRLIQGGFMNDAANRLEELENANQWRPIWTSPKETEVFIGRFIDDKFKFARSELFYEQANVFAGETFSGWVWSEDECPITIAEDPTHWMPLPNSPRNSDEI